MQSTVQRCAYLLRNVYPVRLAAAYARVMYARDALPVASFCLPGSTSRPHAAELSYRSYEYGSTVLSVRQKHARATVPEAVKARPIEGDGGGDGGDGGDGGWWMGGGGWGAQRAIRVKDQSLAGTAGAAGPKYIPHTVRVQYCTVRTLFSVVRTRMYSVELHVDGGC